MRHSLTQLLNLRELFQNRLQEAEDIISGLKDKVHDLDEMNNTCGLKETLKDNAGNMGCHVNTRSSNYKNRKRRRIL